MKLLSDTHIFLWLDSAPEKLKETALALCRDTSNELWFSVASVWGMEIKSRLGKLKLSLSLEILAQSHCDINGLRILVITLPPVFAIGSSDIHNSDPFDRTLIAQEITEQVSLLTADENMYRYSKDARIIW